MPSVFALIPRILVYGGRDFNDATAVNTCLDVLAYQHGLFVLINGGARGADSLAKAWALQRGFPCITMDAPWQSHYGRSAGHVRNDWMVRYANPTHAVEFPGGAGTRNMRDRLRVAGIVPWTPLAND